MVKNLKDNENLLRAVRPKSSFPSHWKDHRPAMQAFIDRRGLSVDRAMAHEITTVSDEMVARLQGTIVFWCVLTCRDACGTHPVPAPSCKNDRHCLIKGSETDIVLSKIQAAKLAEHATVVRLDIKENTRSP